MRDKLAFLLVTLFIGVTTLVAQNVSDKRRTIIFGGDVDFYPYEFINEQGKPDGFNVDLIKAASAHMGLRCIVKIGKWVEIRKELDQHKIDMVGMMYSMERAKQYKIGPTIKFISNYVVYIKGHHEYHDIKDLTDKRIVVESGAISGEIIKNQDIKCHLFYSARIKDALINLSKGQYDAMILETATDKEEKHQCVNLINQNSDMLLRLINDILDFSRLEAGTMDFQIKEINLSHLFESAYSLFMELKKDKGIELKCELPDTPSIIKSDYNRLLQILTNFVTNAFKYTEHGYVKISYRSENGGVKLMVEDTGVGIPKEKIQLVFQRFEKIGSMRQGTGLGLSICKAIVEQFNGEIGVQSECGKGSIFWVWLPVR